MLHTRMVCSQWYPECCLVVRHYWMQPHSWAPFRHKQICCTCYHPVYKAYFRPALQAARNWVLHLLAGTSTHAPGRCLVSACPTGPACIVCCCYLTQGRSFCALLPTAHDQETTHFLSSSRRLQSDSPTVDSGQPGLRQNDGSGWSSNISQ